MKLSRETTDLARNLLAYETVADGTAELEESMAARVFEKLRRPLGALAGIASYRSLLARALTTAQAETPSLGNLQITENGKLQSCGETPSKNDQQHTSEGEVLLTAHFLGLFFCLLGPAVTIQLVLNVFPNLTVTTESGTVTPFEDILKEAGHLNSVSDRLELLANQNPSVESALMSVSGNLRNTATVLEVFAVIKGKPDEAQKTLKRQRKRYLM